MACSQTTVVNAACGYALLDWSLGTTTVLKQERLMAERPGAWDF
jgi:hypothetical protein